ncbi:MAG: GspE/PulE family protein [Pseudomonadota bacterium]
MNKLPSDADFRAELETVLTEQAGVSASDLATAQDVARQSGQALRTVLERMGALGQKDWAQAVATAFQLPQISLDQMPLLLPDVPDLSLEYLQRHAVAPLEVTDSHAVFALADPTNAAVKTALGMLYPGNLNLNIATERDIQSAFARSAEYETPSLTEMPRPVGEGADQDVLVELANDAPTIKYVETLISQAVERRATDIHLEPMERSARVRMRFDGMLSEGIAPSLDQYPGVVSRLKILADLNIAERRLPQDGRIRHKAHGRAIDIRVATAPTVHGEAMTLRLLDTASGLSKMDDLDMPDRVKALYANALKEPNGLILVTGPTGSGKTTTLHAAMGQLNDIGRKIVTIENPVEIRTPGLIQLEVNPDLGWTFAEALRTVLRHDPDVLMVGEIRDAETAELAIRAALTGHLVLSTLHTNRATEAVTRLKNMGVADYLLSSVLRMVAAQRLVRRLCPLCAKSVTLTPDTPAHRTFQKLRSLDPDLPDLEDWALKVPQGCDSCNNTGFSGRQALFEAMGAEAALGQGKARSMGLEGLGMVARGETTMAELIRVVGAPAAWG